MPSPVSNWLKNELKEETSFPLTPSLIAPINNDVSNDGYNEDDDDENCKTDIEIDSNQKFGRIQSRQGSKDSWNKMTSPN